MRIGMIYDEEFPSHPRIWNEAVNLIEDGHQVYLFCFDYSGKPSVETIDGIDVIRYAPSLFFRKLSALAYTLPLYHCLVYKKIKEFITEQKIEILHVHNMRVARAVGYACKNLRIKKVLDLHENVPEIMKYYHHVRTFPGNMLIYPSVWKKWEERLVNQYDKIVVVTEEAKDDLVNNYKIDPEKIIIVPNSVQPSFYSDYSINQEIIEKFPGNFVLLYFGDTGLRRGLETAIRAIPELVATIPEIRLVIVGKSKSDPYLKRLSTEMKAGDHIIFEGFKDEKLLQSYILSADICISPLLRNRHHDTTFANKLFQYMSLGKPILVSDCKAQERITTEAGSGLVHKAGDVEDFRAKVMKLYQNPGLRSQLGMNGKTFVQQDYNQKIKSRELLLFYRGS